VGDGRPLAESAPGGGERFGSAGGDEGVDAGFGELDEQVAVGPVGGGEELAAEPQAGKPIIVDRVTSGWPRSGSARSQNFSSPGVGLASGVGVMGWCVLGGGERSRGAGLDRRVPTALSVGPQQVL
jgi:hypothetical protein